MQTKRTYQQTVIDVVYPDVNLPARTETESVNGVLPETIHINTLVQASSFGFDFCLHEGRIYHKKSAETEWTRMPPDGLPYLENSASFIYPEEIVEIAADGDCLYAFSSAGILYRYYFRKIKTEAVDTWIMNFGWPLPSPLKQNIVVSDKRGWSMGVRRGDILWYEDIYGNEHHYGTMGLETLYFLSADGRSIHFTDSGLPADFSHLIQGPESGRFVAENISVSGSTIFLINRAGEMYTRLIDFDTMGCDPMFFKYTYEKQEQPYKGSEYRSNFTPWALPAEPWKKQPPVPLSGKARLSRFITILQNGQGNAARELRIAGLAKDGSTGYYTKQINDEEWRFAYAPLVIPEDAFLAVRGADAGRASEVAGAENFSGAKTDAARIASERGGALRGDGAGAGRAGSSDASAGALPGAEAFRAEPTNFSYTGYAVKDGVRIPGLTCAVTDFSLASEGKARLCLSFNASAAGASGASGANGADGVSGSDDASGSEEASEISLHFVEAWTYLRRIAPGFDGTPRQFFVTPEFEPDALDAENPAFAALLQEMFGGKNRQLFSCYMEATTGYFQLLTKSKGGQIQLFLTSDEMPAVNPEIVKGSMLYTENIIRVFESDDLVLSKQTDGFSEANVPQIQEKIRRNQEMLAFLQEEISVYKFFHRNSVRSRWGYTILDLFTTVTFLNKIDFPKIKTLTMFGSDIVKINAQNFRQMADLREWIYSHFIELAQARIDSYSALLAEIEKYGSHRFPNVHVFNTFPEYFASVGIPEISAGASEKLGGEAQIYIAKEMAYFPGFFLFFRLNGEDVVFLVELENSLKEILALPFGENLKAHLAESPFRTKANLLLLTAVENAETFALCKEILDASVLFEWDGEKINLLRDGLFSGAKVFFTAFPTDGTRTLHE